MGCTPRADAPYLKELLALTPEEKALRFDLMVLQTFSHVDGRDLLKQIHPRNTLDIKRRVDAVETWFEADWLSGLMANRDGTKHEWDLQELQDLTHTYSD